MRNEAGSVLIGAAVIAAAVLPALSHLAHAQPQAMPGGGARPAGGGMPDLRAMSGKPLPDPGMARGTVSVRVARKMPANGVTATEVTAIIKNAGGDLRKRTARTDAHGRAIFEGMVPGDAFKAEVTVDGERLRTEEFVLPPEGGIRTMLIAGLGAAPAGGATQGGSSGSPAAGGEDDEFRLGAAAGTTQPDPALPEKSLEVHIYDEGGKPIPNHAVELAYIDETHKISLKHGRSDGAGVARFSDLRGGEGTGYAAVMAWHGVRLGVEPFSMPASGGVRAEIRALARTSDPSVIRIGEGARLILQMREDALQFLEIIPLENTSDKLFDPGPGAVEIPLPKGFVGAQIAEGPRKVEVRQNHGIAVHGAISPKRGLVGMDAKTAGNEITFGFVLPYTGSSRDFEQPMPNGMGLLTLITEQIPGLGITGPGVGERQGRELGGRKYWVSPVSTLRPGETLRLSITGLPARDSMGRTVAGGLALALVAGAIAFGRRPKDDAQRAAASERERVTARREALFAELVAVEKSIRGGKADGAPGRRSELVGALEGVYQQLAALDEQRAQ